MDMLNVVEEGEHASRGAHLLSFTSTNEIYRSSNAVASTMQIMLRDAARKRP